MSPETHTYEPRAASLESTGYRREEIIDAAVARGIDPEVISVIRRARVDGTAGARVTDLDQFLEGATELAIRKGEAFSLAEDIAARAPDPETADAIMAQAVATWSSHPPEATGEWRHLRAALEDMLPKKKEQKNIEEKSYGGSNKPSKAATVAVRLPEDALLAEAVLRKKPGSRRERFLTTIETRETIGASSDPPAEEEVVRPRHRQAAAELFLRFRRDGLARTMLTLQSIVADQPLRDDPTAEARLERLASDLTKKAKVARKEAELATVRHERPSHAPDYPAPANPSYEVVPGGSGPLLRLGQTVLAERNIARDEGTENADFARGVECSPDSSKSERVAGRHHYAISKTETDDMTGTDEPRDHHEDIITGEMMTGAGLEGEDDLLTPRPGALPEVGLIGYEGRLSGVLMPPGILDAAGSLEENQTVRLTATTGAESLPRLTPPDQTNRGTHRLAQSGTMGFDELTPSYDQPDHPDLHRLPGLRAPDADLDSRDHQLGSTDEHESGRPLRPGSDRPDPEALATDPAFDGRDRFFADSRLRGDSGAPERTTLRPGLIEALPEYVDTESQEGPAAPHTRLPKENRPTHSRMPRAIWSNNGRLTGRWPISAEANDFGRERADEVVEADDGGQPVLTEVTSSV